MHFFRLPQPQVWAFPTMLNTHLAAMVPTSLDGPPERRHVLDKQLLVILND
jgi:hypothetical protein